MIQKNVQTDQFWGLFFHLKKSNYCRSAEGRALFSINYDGAKTLTHPAPKPSDKWAGLSVPECIHPPPTSSCPTSQLSHRSFSLPQVDSFSSKDTPHPPCCSTWHYIVVALKSGHTFGDVIHAHGLLEMNLVYSLCNRQSTKNRRKQSLMWVEHFERK